MFFYMKMHILHQLQTLSLLLFITAGDCVSNYWLMRAVIFSVLNLQLNNIQKLGENISNYHCYNYEIVILHQS